MPATRNSAVWGAGDFLMILLTLGGWLVLKLGFNYATNRWRCQRCGSAV